MAPSFSTCGAHVHHSSLAIGFITLGTCCPQPHQEDLSVGEGVSRGLVGRGAWGGRLGGLIWGRGEERADGRLRRCLFCTFWLMGWNVGGWLCGFGRMFGGGRGLFLALPEMLLRSRSFGGVVG